MASLAEYSALNNHTSGDKSQPAALIADDDTQQEDEFMNDDEVQVSMNTESDDDDYLQVELEDSYRPPNSTTSSGHSARNLFVVSILVIAVIGLLIVLFISALMYGNTILENVRALSSSWSNALSPASHDNGNSNTHTDTPAQRIPNGVSMPDNEFNPEDDVQLRPITTANLTDPIAPTIANGPTDDAEYELESDAVPQSSILTSSVSSSSALPSLASSSSFAAPSFTSSVPDSSAALTSAVASALLSDTAEAGSSTLQDKTATPALLAHLTSYLARHYSPDMTLDPSRQYLVFTPTDDGLGNKLLPLVSSFFLALILDRTWLVHWVGTEAVHNSRVNIEEVFVPPAGMYWSWSDIVDRSKAKLNKPDTAGDQHQLFRTELCNVARSFNLTCSEFDIRDAGTANIQEKVELSCQDWNTDGRGVENVLVNWGDQYYIPQVQVNAAYRAVITSLFDEDDIFGPLARFLLHPSPAVQSYLTDIQTRFYENHYVVSMQIRRRERLGLRGQEIDTAVKCAKRLAVEGKERTGKDVTFFVASDEAALRDSMVERMRPEGQVVHVANFSVREEQSGVFFAAIDAILLSRGDAIVTTPSSTYGYLSAGFGSLVPWRVQLTPGTDCTHAVNSEPSSHFWHSMVQYSQEEKNKPYCVDYTKFEHLMKQETCCPRW